MYAKYLNFSVYGAATINCLRESVGKYYIVHLAGGREWELLYTSVPLIHPT